MHVLFKRASLHVCICYCVSVCLHWACLYVTSYASQLSQAPKNEKEVEQRLWGQHLILRGAGGLLQESQTARRGPWRSAVQLGSTATGDRAPYLPVPASPRSCLRLAGLPQLESGFPHARAVEVLWVWAQPACQLLPEGHSSWPNKANHKEALQSFTVRQLQGERLTRKLTVTSWLHITAHKSSWP